MDELKDLTKRLLTAENLSTYHQELIKRLGLIANTGAYEADKTVTVPTYDEDTETWSEVSTTLSGAVSQLYKLVATLGLDEDDFDKADFPYNKSAIDNSEDKQ